MRLLWGMSTLSPEPALPDIPRRDVGNSSLLEITHLLLEAEKQDRVELKRLRRRLRPLASTTLGELIVDLLMLDTEKHIRILTAIAALNKSG